MTSCSANEDRAQHLTQKLSRYFLLYQECSDQVRPYGRANMDPIYDEVYKEWRSDPSNPLVEPALGDQGKCDAYFANCDSICALQPQNAHDIYKISFACWAGIQVIQSIQLAEMPDRVDIVPTAGKLAMDECMRKNPELQKSLDFILATPHLRSAFFPGSTVHEVDTGIGPHLVDTTVRYLDQETGEITECYVQDYGTSELRGDWVEVVYDDERELRISAAEMDEILANRIRSRL